MKWLLLALMTSSFLMGSPIEEELKQRAIAENWSFRWQWQGPYATGHVTPEAFHQFPQVAFTHTAVPASYQLTELLPITNQKQCGGCWAFASAGAIENFPGNQGVSLSPQYLIDCDEQSYGCNGGYFTALNQAEQGIPSTASYPFIGHNGTCHSEAPAAHVVQWNMLGGSKGPSTDDIKQALYQKKAPVVVTIFADFAFMSYKSGVFNACKPGPANHMVSIVGWDDSKEAWLVKNSWGETYGEKGYVWIKYSGKFGAKCNGVGASAAVLDSVTFP